MLTVLIVKYNNKQEEKLLFQDVTKFEFDLESCRTSKIFHRLEIGQILS